MKIALNSRLWFILLGLPFLLLQSPNVNAQTYSSGSTGVDGAFAPTSSMSLTLPPNGIFNFTTVNIPTGVTVTFVPNVSNTPVTILATGDVTIAGTLSVKGYDGLPFSATGLVINPGGLGGPGGFPGGAGSPRSSTSHTPTDGLGPGGGVCCFTNPSYGLTYGVGGKYGGNTNFSSLIPLFGGSGGSGGPSDSSDAGASGGGGGGAVLIASSTKITISGLISANGGIGGNNTTGYVNFCSGGYCGYSTTPFEGGGGSGGAIRLVTPQIAGTGVIQAMGGAGGSNTAGNDQGNSSGGPGKIRLEAYTQSFSGSVNPTASISMSLWPATASGGPSFTNLPSLTFSSIGTVTAPATPQGSFSSADVLLPQGTVNPVAVNLAASNIPVGTVFTVRMVPQFSASTTYNTSPSTGTYGSSTASAPVTFPTGQISILSAYASFTVPAQVAMLYPLIDGEPVERVMVAANYGEASTVTLINKSGKELKLAKGYQELR